MNKREQDSISGVFTLKVNRLAIYIASVGLFWIAVLWLQVHQLESFINRTPFLPYSPPSILMFPGIYIFLVIASGFLLGPIAWAVDRFWLKDDPSHRTHSQVHTETGPLDYRIRYIDAKLDEALEIYFNKPEQLFNEDDLQTSEAQHYIRSVWASYIDSLPSLASNNPVMEDSEEEIKMILENRDFCLEELLRRRRKFLRAPDSLIMKIYLACNRDALPYWERRQEAPHLKSEWAYGPYNATPLDEDLRVDFISGIQRLV